MILMILDQLGKNNTNTIYEALGDQSEMRSNTESAEAVVASVTRLGSVTSHNLSKSNFYKPSSTGPDTSID